jgi:glycosyltransferase involved in cell wall biosynthesis/tetratricopeptide (TPR) repeat protein
MGDHSASALAKAFRVASDLRQWDLVLAERHVRAGRNAAAEAAYHQILTRQPAHKSALAGLGRLLLRERRFEEAVHVWQRLVDLEPHRAGPSFQLARALHRSGQYEAAASQYVRVVALDPLHEKAFAALEQLSDRLLRPMLNGATPTDFASRLAQQLLSLDPTLPRLRGSALGLSASFLAKKSPGGPVEYWQQLAEINPRAIEPRLQLARLNRAQQNHDEALNQFRMVLDLASDHAEALLGYGQALEQSDIVAAIRHFAEWAKRNPKDATPRLELARLYQQTDAWDRADTILRDMVEQIPENTAAFARFAQILSRNLKRIEPALDVWQRIAEHDVKSPIPLLQRAQLLERVHRPAEAETEYRAALQRAPQDETALFGLARLLSTESRWNKAHDLYKVLHELKPRRIDVLLGLGRCLERLDRPEEALRTYDKVLILDPANANGLLYCGRLLRQLGRTEEAIHAWQQVCQRAPQNADAWYELIFMLATAERDAEALAALDNAEQALPATPASWIKLGLAAQAGQFNDRAVDLFERAIAAEPNEAIYRAHLGQHYLKRGILDGAFRHLLDARELKPAGVMVARQLVDTIHALNVLGVDHVALEKASTCGEILAPEALFKVVRQIADRDVQPYAPVPRRIINVSSSLAGGGAERQLVNLLRGFSDPALGLDLSLFCVSLAKRTRRDFFLPLLKSMPVEIVTPDESALESYLSAPEVAPYSRVIRAFSSDMALPIAFWLGEFRRRRPEVVHAWQDGTNLTTVVAALLAGVPRIVLSARSVRPDNPRRRLKRFMQDGYRAVLGHRSVVLSNNSRAGANDYADWLGIDPASIEVIYNGIDFHHLARRVDISHARQERSRLGIPADAPVLASAFRMSEEKRPLLWVEVAAEVARQEKRAHFVVYGDGPLRRDMLDLAKHRGIANRLHLPGARDDIASCYMAMDVVMLTSRHEGLPNALLEAQSLGIPVVAPDVGGVGEAVWQGVTGWAVAPADAASMANRVLFCLHDRMWTNHAHDQGPGFVREHFGIPALVRRTLEVYGFSQS